MNGTQLTNEDMNGIQLTNEDMNGSIKKINVQVMHRTMACNK